MVDEIRILPLTGNGVGVTESSRVGTRLTSQNISAQDPSPRSEIHESALVRLLELIPKEVI